MKSYLGLILGVGLLGGVGMGIGYAAATPAAVKWFGPHQRGLIVGLVVGGYGGAAIYITPLASYLVAQFGLSGSLIGLGALFATVTRPGWPAARLPPAASTASARRRTRAWQAPASIASSCARCPAVHARPHDLASASRREPSPSPQHPLRAWIRGSGLRQRKRSRSQR
ncbi:MAG: MFS transporter [Gemmataceae bacterium]